MPIAPRDEQMAALLEKDPGGPINMLNLLKFKEFAEYPDCSACGVISLVEKNEYFRN